MGACYHAIWAQEGVFHLRLTCEAGHDDIACSGKAGGVGLQPAAGCGEVAGIRPLDGGDGEAAGLQVGGDDTAYAAEAQDSNTDRGLCVHPRYAFTRRSSLRKDCHSPTPISWTMLPSAMT